MYKASDHIYLLLSIVFAVYSQCVIRWKLSFSESIPVDFMDKIKFVLGFLWDPWVFSSIGATFLAGVFWIAALTRFELNYAYPWMAAIFIIMTFVGTVFFNESLSSNKLLGTALVAIGLIMVARS